MVLLQDYTAVSVKNSMYGMCIQIAPAPFVFAVGQRYRIVYDGGEYDCTAFDGSALMDGAVLAGNGTPVGLSGNSEPFLIGSMESLDAVMVMCLTDTAQTEHTVSVSLLVEDSPDTEYLIRGSTLKAIGDAIRAKTGKSDPIPVPDMPAEILGITAGGGSSEDVRYVTFMSYDGLTEYGKKAVAVGDDCADPIARDVFDTPTRESTVQYSYTFAGWATTANGGLDANALKAVTEDRTVYANFAAVVRYYTVTYYDADGTTVLKTERLVCGSMPAYTPVKTGFTFTGWTPALAEVTGDASYRAGWIEKMDFGALTWAQISAYCQSGEDVSELFDIGAQKSFSFTLANVSYTGTAEIVGFYHDDLADGTGKAPITLKMKAWGVNTRYWNSGGTTARNQTTWEASEIRKDMQSAVSRLESGLKAIVKKVVKTYRAYDGSYATVEDEAFLASASELGFEITGYEEGACYEAYSGGKVQGQSYAELIHTGADGNARKYWTRSRSASKTIYAISAEGTLTITDQDSASSVYSLGFLCVG